MAKKQTASSTSRPGRRPKPRNYTLSDGTKVVADDNNKRYVTRKNLFTAGVDEEEVLPEPKDAISKHKYPPPKKNKIFRDKWSRFIDLVVERDSFRLAHLDSLEILCDLYVELAGVNTYIRIHGEAYTVVTLTGTDRKPQLEVARRDKILALIAKYTSALDLFPKKDKSTGGDSDGEGDSWK